MLLGAALSVAHAGLSRAAGATGLGVLVVVAVTAVAFEAVGLATGVPYGSYTYSDRARARRCSACRSSCRWPG